MGDLVTQVAMMKGEAELLLDPRTWRHGGQNAAAVSLLLPLPPFHRSVLAPLLIGLSICGHQQL